MNQFDRFTAVFQPQRTDDLKPGATALIGERLEWEAAWIIGGEDDRKHGVSADYEGLFACALRTEFKEHQGFVWTPECDLADIEPVEP